MANKVNIIGKRFHRLVVLYECEKRKNNKIFYHCRCDCGVEKDVCGGDLRNNKIKSCGCYNNDMRKKTGKKNKTHGMSKTRFYRLHSGMLDRCYNKTFHCYKNYGAVGIEVCEEWHKFENFKEDMYESYLKHCKEFGESNTTLDRIDPYGNYEKSNCRWATCKEQANNRRNNHMVLVNGVKLTMSKAREIVNISKTILTKKLKRYGKHGFMFNNYFIQDVMEECRK